MSHLILSYVLWDAILTHVTVPAMPKCVHGSAFDGKFRGRLVQHSVELLIAYRSSVSCLEQSPGYTATEMLLQHLERDRINVHIESSVSLGFHLLDRLIANWPARNQRK